MICNMVEKLSESERLEFIKLNERLLALEELKLGKENFELTESSMKELFNNIEICQEKTKKLIQDFCSKRGEPIKNVFDNL
ncbi:MAG TPA: hypothetical protein DCL31_16740 [Clostridium sp.]|nr:hypothetical protein [Clostridium sp.]